MSSRATLHLDTHHNVGVVDRRIFGGFLEHLGRAVYQGVYDPGNEYGLSDADGFRTDVMAALKPLGMPVMRYPGGNFVSCYDWKDGIGPRDQRQARPDFAWRTVEPNQFGTDEFMRWCKRAGTAPMMAVNLGTKGAEDAAHLLEYCNLPVGTSWADQRARNGSPEPYGVKLWCLGNEMDGPWQAGHVPAAVYAQRARAAAAMMKGLDPTIETIACGSSNRYMGTYMAYDREVLEYTWDYVDYVSAHAYSNNNRNDPAWYLAEGTEIDRVIADYAGLFSFVRAGKRSAKRVHLSFDEWNVWYRANRGDDVDGHWKTAPHLLEEWYNLEDALVCAQYLNAFIRRADVVKVACIAQIVNVIAPIMTRAQGLLLQTIYFPMAEMSAGVAAGAKSLAVALESPNYKAGDRGEVPTLDVSATFDPATGDVSVFAVNRSITETLVTDVRVGDRVPTSIKHISQLTGPDLKAGNTWDAADRVIPQPGRAVIESGIVRLTVPAAGFASLKFATTAR